MSRAEAEENPAAVARGILLRQLTARARTRAQLRDALLRRNIPEDVAEEALDRFTEVGLIDDRAYAQAVIRNEAGSGGLSRRRVRQRLLERGVAGELVDEAVSGISTQDEERAALELARRKVPRMAGIDPDTRRRRLIGLLVRRGYSPQIVHSVTRQVLEDGSLAL